MALCQESKSDNYINWWFKLYIYQEKYARKLKNKKLKKLRKLTGETDALFIIEIISFSLEIFIHLTTELSALIFKR